MRVSVVLPAYNEEKRIVSRIQSLVKYFDGALGEYELLVIADGCTDRTSDVVLKYASITDNNSKIRVLNFSKRLGKGGAIIEGLKAASGDVMVITDADDSASPEELLKLIKEAETEDLVIGSRYAEDSKLLVREPFIRYFLGRAYNALTRLMFWRLRGIHDTQCGAKVVKSYVVGKIIKDLFITGFTFDVNLIYSAARSGFKIREKGITWRHVEYESKISKALIKVIMGMFFFLIKLRLYYSRFRPILDTIPMRHLSGFIWKLTKA